MTTPDVRLRLAVEKLIDEVQLRYPDIMPLGLAAGIAMARAALASQPMNSETTPAWKEICDILGWEWNVDSGGKDGPIYRRKDWKTSKEKVVYAYTVKEILQLHANPAGGDTVLVDLQCITDEYGEIVLPLGEAVANKAVRVIVQRAKGE